jgi:hypothetical protein
MQIDRSKSAHESRRHVLAADSVLGEYFGKRGHEDNELREKVKLLIIQMYPNVDSYVADKELIMKAFMSRLPQSEQDKQKNSSRKVLSWFERIGVVTFGNDNFDTNVKVSLKRGLDEAVLEPDLTVSCVVKPRKGGKAAVDRTCYHTIMDAEQATTAMQQSDSHTASLYNLLANAANTKRETPRIVPADLQVLSYKMFLESVANSITDFASADQRRPCDIAVAVFLRVRDVDASKK